MLNGELHLHPKMPDTWKRLSFPLYWKGSKLKISITEDQVEIKTDQDAEIELVIYGKKTAFTGQLQFEMIHI